MGSFPLVRPPSVSILRHFRVGVTERCESRRPIDPYLPVYVAERTQARPARRAAVYDRGRSGAEFCQAAVVPPASCADGASCGNIMSTGTQSASAIALNVLMEPVFPVHSIWDNMLGVIPTSFARKRPLKPRHCRMARTGFSPAEILRSMAAGRVNASSRFFFSAASPLAAANSRTLNCLSGRITRRSLALV